MSLSSNELGVLMRVVALVASVFAVFAVPAERAAAVPPCWPDCEIIEEEPPPGPQPASPVVALDTARQTTDRGSVRVVGWTADDDAPLDPLKVRISIDGVLVATVTADGNRPDVATAHPQYGAAHGYEVVVAAPATARDVCVVAVNVGSGADSTLCKQIVTVTHFEAVGIEYDVAGARRVAANLDQLDSVTNTNQTTVEQSTTISGQRVLTDTQGWTDTWGAKITMSAKVKIPFFDGIEVTVTGEASHTWAQNGSSSESRTFGWSQPVRVPAKSRVVATVAVTRSTLVVPYTMTGSYVYSDGVRVAGSIKGTYSGINSHNLQVTLVQYNLDGSLAAKPVDQPAATLSVS